MIDRITRPAVEKINSVEFLAPIEYSLTEKVSLFHMKQVPNDTCRLDLYFDAGKVTGEKGIASFVNGVLLSGTEEKTSQEINETIMEFQRTQFGGWPWPTHENTHAKERGRFAIYADGTEVVKD